VGCLQDPVRPLLSQSVQTPLFHPLKSLNFSIDKVLLGTAFNFRALGKQEVVLLFFPFLLSSMATLRNSLRLSYASRPNSFFFKIRGGLKRKTVCPFPPPSSPFRSLACRLVPRVLLGRLVPRHRVENITFPLLPLTAPYVPEWFFLSASYFG